jgi:hypothetical protein
MANTVIKVKRSSSPGQVPSSLDFGVLALNYADGAIWANASNGSIIKLNRTANTFSTINANNTLLTADLPGSILTIEAGDNIIIVANSISDSFTIEANLTLAIDQANTAYNTAVGAFAKANTGTDISPAFNQANTAYNTAVGAFAKANTGGDISPAFNQANTAQNTAVAAFGQANTAYNTAVGAFAKANTTATVQTQDTWNTGTGTTESIVSPFKIKTSVLTYAVPYAGGTLTGGFVGPDQSDGSKSSGTYTPSPSTGNWRRVTNNGAFTLAAPSDSGEFSILIEITNGASAGAITLSGFTKTDGDAFTTTNGHVFWCWITKYHSRTHIQVRRVV